MQSIPSSLPPPQPQVKKPLARGWWIGLLTCWIVSWVIGAALVAAGLTVYQGTSATFDDAYTMLFVGVGFLGLGFLVMIAFWVVWGIRRKQKKRLLAASIVQPASAYAPAMTFSAAPPTQSSVKPSQQYGASELSEQYIQGQQQQHLQYIPGQQSNTQVSHFQPQHASPIVHPSSTVTELPDRKPEWHWTATQPVEAASVSPAPMAELPVYTSPSPQHAPSAPSVMPSSTPATKIAEIDQAIAAIDGLVPGTDSVIQADFDYVSRSWGSEVILVMDKAAISELLYKVVRDDRAAGLPDRDVISSAGDRHQPPYVQVNTSGSSTFRPYRIAKRQDGRTILYGHEALYRARRALGHAGNTSATTRSVAGLIAELIDVGKTEGALLGPRGEELWGRVRLIGEALREAGGKSAMLQAQEAVRDSLGPVRARELEVAWDGISS